MNRETWLNNSIAYLQREVFDGIEIPKDVQLTCGWPSKGGTAKQQTQGQCWSRINSKAGVNEVFISPTIDNSIETLGILVHELIHAVDDCKSGHKKAFKDMALAVGLEGKMRSTEIGESLRLKLESIVKELGEYPHKELTPPGPKQKSRQLKLECRDCGVENSKGKVDPTIWRMSKLHQDRAVYCPCCGSENIERV
tara:strand:- start:489 stop:1076 length:588 start_codon:yes stop_codon:yes gene_type:complete